MVCTWISCICCCTILAAPLRFEAFIRESFPFSAPSGGLFFLLCSSWNQMDEKIKLHGPLFLYSKRQRFHAQRNKRWVAPADCWNWGEWVLKEYKWKGSFLSWLVCWVRCAGTRDFCPALVAVVGPVQNKFFLSVHSFSQLSRQSSWVTCLLISASVCSHVISTLMHAFDMVYRVSPFACS